MKITLNLDQYTFLEKEDALEKYKEQVIARDQYDHDFSTTYERFIDSSYNSPQGSMPRRKNENNLQK